MKYLTRRIVLLTALYVCIIFGIFALQFTSGNAFSVTLGSLRVSGTMEDTGKGGSNPALPLHIGTTGLDFFLDSQNSLMAYKTEKNGEPLKVTGLVQDETGFTVNFTGKVSVSFSSAKRGDKEIVSITATMPSKYQKLVFPYKVTRSARLEKQDSLVLVSTGDQKYVFTGAAINPPSANGIRGLAISRSAPVVYYQTWIPAKGLSIEDLATFAGASDDEYIRTVDAYAAKTLVAFKDSVSSGKFGEPLAAAYIAEMSRIGMYQAAVESIPESWRNSPNRTWLTSPYLANLEATWAGLVTKEREDRSMISRKLTENNPSVFEYPSLVPYLVDRGSSILLKDVSRLASSLDMASVTTRQAAGILEAMTDFSVYSPDLENTLLALADSCERKLKASLVMTDNALFISDDGKTVNTLESLQIASILVRYGESSNLRASWKYAGHLLASSLAPMAPSNGSLPAQLVFDGEEGQAVKTGVSPKDEKTIPASVVYPALVTGNTWYPHALSLAKDAGPGVWAWTVAQSVKVTKPAENTLKIMTRFPQGETHYMVIRGIKRFYRISIYGMDFRTDPRFESYNSSGYRYNEETETLFLKMRHKSEYEDIVIYFGSDPSQPAQVPGAAAASDSSASADGSSSAPAPSAQ